jgi:2-keto-4-pentenoate hydratase/2-oxohepta-3-ene-1,7-dioic acid hydratase in catechol pathway
MIFATFEYAGYERVGLVDIATGSIRSLDVLDMVDLIARFDSASPDLLLSGKPDLYLPEVRLLAPIPRPARNIFCVGKNYREHANEFAKSGYEAGAVIGAEIDEYPAVFTKPASSVVGPGAAVDTHPQVTSEVDYEAELAIVIGRGGRDIKRVDAMRHVWGYTIINDVTARDLQKRHRQWFLGKGLDTFCPMGPWIVTADEITANDLHIQTQVNGELRQDANTRDLIFDIPSLINSISAGMTLLPGDLIATGTPAGVGIGFKPPRFLKAGDNVTITIAGIGTLSNTFK